MKKGKALTALRKARRDIEREIEENACRCAQLKDMLTAIEREIAVLETIAETTRRAP